MKTLVLLLGAALACCQCASVEAATRTVKLQVSNMSCVTCPLTVKAALNRVPGVGKIKVDFASKQALVTFDDLKTNTAALRKATADVGFPSTLAK